MPNYDEQKKYFERAYATGTDIWTHTPFTLKGKEFVERLSPSAIILDLGSGRGRFPFDLGKLGFRVIGLDYIKSIVEKNNQEVKMLGVEKTVRFVEGDVFDIPFSDDGFDAVADVGLLQHIQESDWSLYASEVARVTKPGGYFLLVALSKETTQFLNWSPKKHEESDFVRDDVFYHFFTQAEIKTIFSENFEIISERIDYLDSGGEVAYAVNVLKRK